jgi:predicted DNA-binding ribbon-helix-helix protein
MIPDICAEAPDQEFSMLDSPQIPPTHLTMKVLQRAGKRLAIKLEHIFWVQLEELAERAKLSLAKYVHTVLETAGPDDNRACVLRCHCLKAARDEKISAYLTEGDLNLTLMLTACPSPAFILKDERTIVAHNPAFASRFMTETETGQGGRAFVRISYTRPFTRLREFLQQNPNKALNTLLVLSTRAKTHNCRARLMLAGHGTDAFVLVFLEEDLDKPASVGRAASSKS